MANAEHLRNRYPMVFVPSTNDSKDPDIDLPGMYIAASDRHFGIFMPIPSFETVSGMSKEEFEVDIVVPISEHFARAAMVYIKHMKKRGFTLPLPEIPGHEGELDYAVIRLEGLIAHQSSEVADKIDEGAEHFGEWFLFVAPPGVPMEEFLSSSHAMRLN